LARYYYWPNLRNDVQHHVLHCKLCAENKALNLKQAGLLQALPIPSKPWSSISIDFITGLPRSKSRRESLMVIVDRLTEMVHLRALGRNASAPVVAKVFTDTVVALHGLPTSIISDRDTRFTFAFWQQVTSLLGVKLYMSSGYHPKTDGQTERVNRVVGELFRARCRDKEDEWDTHLGMMEFAINSAKHSSTGYTPFYLNYGHHSHGPEALIGREDDSEFFAGRWFAEELQGALYEARENLRIAQLRMKQQADKHRRALNFAPGDQVYLSTENFRQFLPGVSANFKPRWIGRFTIELRIGDVAYPLATDRRFHMRHPVFHVSQLKAYPGVESGQAPSSNETRTGLLSPQPTLPTPLPRPAAALSRASSGVVDVPMNQAA
jgi:hypothetical protein